MTALLRAEHLFCTLPSSDGERVLFRDLSLQVESGEIVDLTGPSGSGKSSLLTALAQLNPHASGDLTMQGRPASVFTPQQWRTQVTYLPQQAILTGGTVAEAIRLPFTLAVRAGGPNGAEGGHDGGRRRFPSLLRGTVHHTADRLGDAAIRRMLDALGCGDIELDRPPHDLSGGQAARVALARTLLTRPKVLLADEVDAGLDDNNAAKVAAIMTRAAHDGMAVIRIRHRPPDGASSRTLVLSDGRLRGNDATHDSGGNDMQVAAHADGSRSGRTQGDETLPDGVHPDGSRAGTARPEEEA